MLSGGDIMQGRENKISNDLFFVCSLIDYISRRTLNHRSTVIELLGKKKLQKILDLADIYHSENIDRVSDDLIQEAGIPFGEFDNVTMCKYSIPSYWDIGKVYKRLIKGIAESQNMPIIDALFLAYNSFISPKIDDYNSSFYYENPDNILRAYLEGVIE